MNLTDFGILAGVWMASEGDAAFLPVCDLSPDGLIDRLDVTIFATNWLAGT